MLADDNNFQDIDVEEFGYIIPSKKFNSFEEFINALQIPYYEDYEIVVVDGDKNSCFDGSSFLKSRKIEIIFLFFAILNLF